VIISDNSTEPTAPGVVRFPSVGDFMLPEYPELRLHFPPILDIMDFIVREGFTRIHISTPGSVGLLGLLIARLMDIPAAGTYHTDIPQYVRSLPNDEFLEQVAWDYMIWFYSQMDEVMVPSVGTRNQLIARGLPAERMKPLPRWVDSGHFSPDRREALFWRKRGLTGALILLYVGRVSREKSLDLLVTAFRQLVDDGADISLAVIVSDQGGPRELMVEGETGLVFPVGSRQDLITAVRSLISDRRRNHEMGLAARQFTLTNAPDRDATYGTILKAT
jgi:glycosyltransferase involved in cell wall biosynthesis